MGVRPPVDSAIAASLTLGGKGAERATRRSLGHGRVALVGANVVATRAVVLGGQVGLRAQTRREGPVNGEQKAAVLGRVDEGAHRLHARRGRRVRVRGAPGKGGRWTFSGTEQKKVCSRVVAVIAPTWSSLSKLKCVADGFQPPIYFTKVRLFFMAGDSTG